MADVVTLPSEEINTIFTSWRNCIELCKKYEKLVASLLEENKQLQTQLAVSELKINKVNIN